MQEIFEKIIEKLESKLLNLTFQKNDKNKGFNDGIHKAIEIVKQAATEYNGWIPCSERLPEESLNSVLGWDEYRKRCCFVEYWSGRWILGNDIDSVKITAWQPLPEPPQKGE